MARTGLTRGRAVWLSPALLTYAAVVFGLFLIPGLAVLLVPERASTSGRRVGIASGLSIATRDLLHTAFTTMRLSAILMTSALAFSLVRYAGVTYLLYLGLRAIMEKGRELQPRAPRVEGVFRAYLQAILMELLNLKTALFFLAFLPQFVHFPRGFVTLQLATLGLVFALMSADITR